MKNKIQKQHGKRLVMGKDSWKALVISLDKLSLVPYKEHCAPATKMILKIQTHTVYSICT